MKFRMNLYLIYTISTILLRKIYFFSDFSHNRASDMHKFLKVEQQIGFMNNKKGPKIDRLQYFRRSNNWKNHRPWYIYTTARKLEQPFSLDTLQDGIRQKIGVQPRISRILEEADEFYGKYGIALISQVEPGAGAFIVNPDIDLSKKYYRAIIHPPQKRIGRPQKEYVQSPEDHRRYARNYHRFASHPEKFLAPVFQAVEQASVEEISGKIHELAEGVSFSSATIKRLLSKYIKDGKGPPHLWEICDGVYRRAQGLHEE